MRNIKIFLNGFYQATYKDFWMLIGANIVAMIILRSYQFHEFAEAGIIGILVWKCFSFLRSESIMPSIASDFDRYSWKYFQGLPLNKEELLISLVICNVFVMFPAVVWLMCFFTQIANLFRDSTGAIHWEIPVKVFLCLVPILFLLSIKSISNLITFPRIQYSKNPPQLVFLNGLKNILVVVAVGLYAWFAYDAFVDYSGFKIVPYLSKVASLFSYIFKSWLIIFVVPLVVAWSFFSTLNIWQNEKKSYKKLTWVPKKDYAICALCFSLIYIPYKMADFDTPQMYQGSELLKAVYSKDTKAVDMLLSKGMDINKSNKLGVSPIMLAAHEGNLEMFKFLEAKGAKLEGKLTMKNDKLHSGMNLLFTAIDGKNAEIVKYLLDKGHNPNEMNQEEKYHAVHLAAFQCETKILDLLIEKNADLTARNSKGQTALHSAARKKCFGSVVSLIDAKIDPMIKDKENKMAYDYLENSKSGDISYFLEKRSRAPAGK